MIVVFQPSQGLASFMLQRQSSGRYSLYMEWGCDAEEGGSNHKLANSSTIWTQTPMFQWCSQMHTMPPKAQTWIYLHQVFPPPLRTLKNFNQHVSKVSKPTNLQ